MSEEARKRRGGRWGHLSRPVYVIDENGKGVTHLTTLLTREEIQVVDSRAREWVGPVNEVEQEAIITKLRACIAVTKSMRAASALETEITNFLALFESGMIPVGPIHANCIIREYVAKIRKTIEVATIMVAAAGLVNLRQAHHQPCAHQQQTTKM